jgi:ADP-ribosyltransferase exoenzyme/Phage Mu protein F like protein
MNWPEQKVVARLTAQYATKIKQAFKSAIDGDAIARSWAETHPAGGSVSPQTARDWALAHAVVNQKPLQYALSRIYADGYTLGVKVAKTRLTGLKKGVTANVVDWSTWKPGLPSAAALVKPMGGLKELLDSQKITIANEITRTKLDRIGTALATSLSRGDTARETAKAIDAIIADPQHALVIARTEMARAMSVASREQYQNAGVEQVEWLVAEGCADCQENADASPIPLGDEFPTGDTEPPAHPNCMCAIAPVFDDSALPAEGNVPEELSPEDFASASEDFATAAMAEEMYADLQPTTNDNIQNVLDVMNQQRAVGFEASAPQVEAIADYTSGSGMYGEVNLYLREGEFDRYTSVAKQGEVLNIIKQLDSVIKEAPVLNENMLTYRGIWGTKTTQFFTNLKPGDTFTDEGFISTSLNKDIAANFARYDKANGGIMLEIVNPKGTKGIFPLALRTEMIPKYIGENEWLLPRNTKFKVVSIEGRTIRVVVNE